MRVGFDQDGVKKVLAHVEAVKAAGLPEAAALREQAQEIASGAHGEQAP